jgi:hypothetical protein
MAAFKKNSTYSVESSLKYFIIGSLASAFFLFGSSLLYGCLGSLNFDDFRMFSSILFQKDISPFINTNSEFAKTVSPAALAIIKLLATEISDQDNVSICPKHCYVIPVNWMEKVITNTISHPLNDSLRNLFMYLSPFFLVEKTDNSSSFLIDYYLNNSFNAEDNLLPMDLMKINLTAKESSEEELMKIFFFRRGR